jgi:hypothetical protein
MVAVEIKVESFKYDVSGFKLEFSLLDSLHVVVL